MVKLEYSSVAENKIKTRGKQPCKKDNRYHVHIEPGHYEGEEKKKKQKRKTGNATPSS